MLNLNWEDGVIRQRTRVLIAKPGLDGHDRGAKVIARAFRDAGMEVIYTGLRQTPESIAETALQEDVAVVGLSILSGAHMTLVPRVLESLKQLGLEGVLVLVGGVIPESDAEALRTQGVDGVFGPGTSMEEVIGFVQGAIEDRRVRV
jgi:methylmalonyl-CoA mutase C-terminal domain/subunit